MTAPRTLDTYAVADHLSVSQLAAALNCSQAQIWGDALTRKRLPRPTTVNGKHGWNVGEVLAAIKGASNE